MSISGTRRSDDGLTDILPQEVRTDVQTEDIAEDAVHPVSSRWKLIAYFKLLVYAKPTFLDIGLLVTGLIAAIATGVPLPLLAIVFGQLIDDFNGATCSAEVLENASSVDDSNINDRILLVVYLAIGQFIAIYIHLICWSLIGSRLAQRTRELYLSNLLRQEPCFFDQFNEGDISSRLNSDIQAIRNGTSEKVGICISAIACLVGAYIVAFIKYPRLAGILVCLIPAYLIMSIGGGHFIEKYSSLLSDHVAAAANIASESLSHMTVVHAFGANSRLERIFGIELDKAKAAGTRKAIATGVQSGLLYFIAYAANGLAFWQGSKAVAKSVRDNTSGTTVGSIFTVIFVVVDATVVLSQTIPLLPVFGAACAAFVKLRQEIERASSIDPASIQGRRLPMVKGHLEFRGISFTHPSRPDVPVLKDVSLEIPAGLHTAIVGPSGSGKSTIAGLIARLYDADSGSVLLDGTPLNEVVVQELRRHVSLAQQDAGLLDQSILENIAHGLVNSPMLQDEASRRIIAGNELKEVAQSLRAGQSFASILSNADQDLRDMLRLIEIAAKQADAYEFILRLKHSFGTIVGPQGQFLSGGQKQRVGLARALAKGSQIMIFDEATSALDASTEQRITQNLKKLMVGKTVVTIAHRLSTVRHADKIVVLQAGEIVEQGTHNELMARNGSYARLIKLQTFESADHETELPSSDDTRSTSDTRATTKPSTKATTPNPVEQIQEGNLSVSSEASASPDVETSGGEGAGVQENKSFSTIFKIFGPITRPYALMILPALAATSVVGAAFSIEAVIFGNTVGYLSPCQSPSTISSKGAFFGLMFFVLAIAELLANMASWSLFGEISDGVVRMARILSFRTLLQQDVQWHQSQDRKPAMLLNFITRDGDLLAGLSGSVLGVAFSIAINLVVSIVLTTVIAWKIALVCLAIVPLFLGIGLMQLRVMARFEERHENAYTTSVSIGVEAVSNIKTVASFSLEDDTLKTYRMSLAAPKKETTAITFHANLWLALAYFVGNLGYALAFWWGGQQIVKGAYGQVEFLIVVFSLLVSAQLWSGMFALAPEISNARAALGRISGLLRQNPGRTSASGALIHSTKMLERDLEKAQLNEKTAATSLSSYDQKGLEVVMKDVTFSYPSRPDVRVLTKVSLQVSPGQFCALVGSTGAGKSTVVALIEKMYTPLSGSIFIGHLDITKTSDLSFRNELAYVPQDNSLFDGTISFNVGLGALRNLEASQTEIEDACKAAHIHETIVALPQGYHTRVGNSGGHLSGGQKQRLAIARALVRRPKLLILDEPTSALDAETESLLQATLDGIARDTGMTIIVIAHRMKTIYRADMIYVFEHGQVVGRGTHEELLKSNEAYRTNASHQML